MLHGIGPIRDILAFVTDVDLRSAISDLPPDERQLIGLFLLGYTHREISEFIGVSRSTITRRLSRIRGNLSHHLKK